MQLEHTRRPCARTGRFAASSGSCARVAQRRPAGLRYPAQRCYGPIRRSAERQVGRRALRRQRSPGYATLLRLPHAQLHLRGHAGLEAVRPCRRAGPVRGGGRGGCGRGRLRPRDRHGPLLPDRRRGLGGGADARGVHGSRRNRGTDGTGHARDDGHGCDLSEPGHAGEDGHHARHRVQGSGDAWHRRRLERDGARRLRHRSAGARTAWRRR